MSKKVDIKSYGDYFHDGSLIDIENINHDIVITLESAEIEPNEINDHTILSKSNTLYQLKQVKAVKLDNEMYEKPLIKLYDDGEILDLEISPEKVFLLVEWANYPPKLRTSDVSTIEIEAKDIYRENMPSADGYKLS